MKYSKLFLIPAIFFMCGCSSASSSSFKLLGNNEVLVIGETRRVRNYSSVVNSDVIVTVPADDRVYNLTRSTYQTYGDEIYRNGYYYRLNSSSGAEKEINLGKKKVVTEYSYGYMPYGKDNFSVVVQTTVKTITTYSYQSHWETYNINVTLNLNNYFVTEAEFKQALPELAEKVEESKSGKLYVNAVDREIVTNNTQMYDTYYYIEKV